MQESPCKQLRCLGQSICFKCVLCRLVKRERSGGQLSDEIAATLLKRLEDTLNTRRIDTVLLRLCLLLLLPVLLARRLRLLRLLRRRRLLLGLNWRSSLLSRRGLTRRRFRRFKIKIEAEAVELVAIIRVTGSDGSCARCRSRGC